MPKTALMFDGEARDAALTLLEGHPDVSAYQRVFPAQPGAERYQVTFLDGRRFTVEVAYDGKQEAA